MGAFDGGLNTSNAGALLLGATSKAIRLADHFAGCFSDVRCAGHTIATLVGQRAFDLAQSFFALRSCEVA